METFWLKLSRLTSDVQTVSFTSCPMCFGSTNLQFLTLLKETTSCCKFAFRIKMLFIYISAIQFANHHFIVHVKLPLNLYFCCVLMIYNTWTMISNIFYVKRKGLIIVMYMTVLYTWLFKKPIQRIFIKKMSQQCEFLIISKLFFFSTKRRISEMLSHFQELEGILSGRTSLGGKVTVFMPSDLTMMSLRNETRKSIFVEHSDRALRVRLHRL